MLLGIADSLRLQLEQHRLREGGGGEASEAAVAASELQQLTLQRQIVWLEGFDRVTGQEQIAKSRLHPSSRGFQGVWDNDLGCRVTYKPAFLLQCLVMSFSLRSSHELPDVIKSAIACLPEFWKNTLLGLLSEAKTPSASTLSRARLTVDAAFMLWMRKQHADLLVDENLTLFVKVDSTPLGGNNWEVVEYQVVAGDRWVEAANLATSMVKLGVKCASQEASISQCQELGVLTGAVSQFSC